MDEINRTELLNELVEELAVARNAMVDAKTELQKAQEDVDLTEEGRNFIYAQNVLSTTKTEVSALESKTRSMAVELFNDTGDKKPHGKINIVIGKDVFIVDEKLAKQWAIGVDSRLVSLEATPFNALVKAMAEKSLDLEFARVYEEPKARIASKLE